MEKNMFTREELFELYKLYIERENTIRKSWRNGFSVYSTIILTFIGSIVVLLNAFNELYFKKIFLGFGGLFVLGIALIAYFHFRLDYKFQMEILTVQMKIEDLLGMTDESFVKLPKRWNNEGLLPPWYYKNKQNEGSAEDFVKNMCSLKNINGYSLIYALLSVVGFSLMICALLL